MGSKHIVRTIHAPLRYFAHSRLTVCLIGFLCVCVLVQMLGLPVTLLSLFTPSDLLTASTCADPLMIPSIPELHLSSPLSFCIDRYSPVRLSLLLTLVFHPPLT